MIRYPQAIVRPFDPFLCVHVVLVRAVWRRRSVRCCTAGRAAGRTWRSRYPRGYSTPSIHRYTHSDTHPIYKHSDTSTHTTRALSRSVWWLWWLSCAGEAADGWDGAPQRRRLPQGNSPLHLHPTITYTSQACNSSSSSPVCHVCSRRTCPWPAPPPMT